MATLKDSESSKLCEILESFSPVLSFLSAADEFDVIRVCRLYTQSYQHQSYVPIWLLQRCLRHERGRKRYNTFVHLGARWHRRSRHNQH